MPSSVSNSLAVLSPPPDTDAGYWVRFIKETTGAMERLFDTVTMVQSTEERNEQDLCEYDLVLAVAPSKEIPVPRGIGTLAWIPSIGETVRRENPWASADLILLPLGVRVVHHDLPLTHLGYGVTLHTLGAVTGTVVIHGRDQSHVAAEIEQRAGSKAVAAADHDEVHSALERASVAIIWPCSCASGLSTLFAAASRGVVSIIPDTDPVLSYFCTRSGAGIPCATLTEAVGIAQILQDQPEKRTALSRAAHHFLRRNHSWSRVSRRLASALDALVAPKPLVHTIVLNWNGRELLPDCLESLRDQEYPRMVPVVVDNGSTDESCSFVENVFPECRIIRNDKNLGFAKGNNIGMQRALRAGADYVALLNNDTRVCRRWLHELVETAERESAVGAVGSRMLFHDTPRMINSAGGLMNQSFYGWDRGVFEHDGARWQRFAYCLFVTGGSILLRSAALRRVGLFDPAYFAYYEDNDLCHRLRQDRWRIAYQPKSRVFHKVSATSGPISDWKTYLLERSRYRFVLKNVPFSYLSRHGAKLLAQEHREIRHWWSAREYRRLRIQFHALLGALFGLPDIVRWRLMRASGRNSRWVHQLEPGFARPIFSTEREELSDVYRGLVPDGRTMVTCMPWALTGAWSSVVQGFPRYRLLQGTGSVRFTTAPLESGYIQFHFMVPAQTAAADFHVRMPSCALDDVVCVPGSGWHTALIEVTNVPGHPSITLTSSSALGFNEVSLLPQNSALVRRS